METLQDTAHDPNNDEGAAYGRSVMERFWAAADAGDMDTVKALVHPEVVMDWPQSGERFSGRDRALAAMQATEVKPEPAGEPRLLGAGATWVAMMPLRYGSEISHYVGVFELRDGLIARSTEYFGAPFPASEARSRYADPR